ncbi:MAG: hydantoinase/oxoprolinase family protein [Alphaproteobacteria bacterium]|nr:hydantoinase/oxoprolinase family protein [Alphaproteobacteria bacterium]
MSAHSEDIEIGIDIGGTFTDVVCRRKGGPETILKLPTTRADPGMAVLQALDSLSSDFPPEHIVRFVHGTTVATNAVLERKGAKVGILTTDGFRDVLEIGRQIRQALYSVILKPETPVFLAPGARRREVHERISSTGEVLTPLDEQSVLDAVEALAADGVEAIAICFLFSFLEPKHEIRARDLIAARYPEIAVSISSEVDPAFREYERTLATAFDAYIKPIVDGYLDRLETNLRTAGVPAPLQVMQSRGGASGASVVRRRPVRMFLSGPAAGVIGGRMAGAVVGATNLITVDIGGTTSDIALIEDGAPIIRTEGVIDGFPIRVPMVDVNPVGAGGGSIAWIDDAGGLRVGPQSAGSEPGPACYGRGGEDATVTDASVVLGYLDPQNFAGGTMSLDAARAQDIVKSRVAKPLGLELEAAALGIHQVINAQMAEGIRLVSIQRGFDPRDFALVALGGAGPLHAAALAEELRIGRIVVPRHPGVLSAAGLLAAPVEHEISASFARPLDGLDIANVVAELERLDAGCAALMREDGIEANAVETQHAADVCFVGQSYHLEVSLELRAADPLAKLRRDFLALHDRIYGYSTDSPARIVNLRSVQRAGGETPNAETPNIQGSNSPKAVRRILLGDGPVEAAIYDRDALSPSLRFDGPAIIEQSDTTTLIPNGWHAEATADGSLVLNRESTEPAS